MPSRVHAGRFARVSVAYCPEANTFPVTHYAFPLSTRRLSRLITHAARVMSATLVAHHSACNYTLESRQPVFATICTNMQSKRDSAALQSKETRCAAYQQHVTGLLSVAKSPSCWRAPSKQRTFRGSTQGLQHCTDQVPEDCTAGKLPQRAARLVAHARLAAGELPVTRGLTWCAVARQARGGAAASRPRLPAEAPRRVCKAGTWHRLCHCVP